MNVIVVDDEPIVLAMETAMIKKVLPEAEVGSFHSAEEALEYAAEKSPAIAFLDINLAQSNGLILTRRLQELNPKINIIFCTGYSEYALDALELYCSGYLMKPVTEEKIRKAVSRLRYPVEHEKKGLYVQCFGNFEVFYNGSPVSFKYGRTKELLAYLIDRNGVLVSTKEIMSVLFGDEDKSSYFRNLRADLLAVLQKLGAEDVIIQSWGKMGIDKKKIACDYFRYLAGEKEPFQGEYMSQYSFSDKTLGRLMN